MAIHLTTANNVGMPVEILPAGMPREELLGKLWDYGKRAQARAETLGVHVVTVRAWKDSFRYPDDLLSEITVLPA
jgi:hypothetical protein